MRQFTDASTDLKKVLTDRIPKEQQRVKAFRKDHGSTKIGEVTVDMVRTITFFYINEPISFIIIKYRLDKII